MEEFYCPVNLTADVIAGKWKPLVIYYLEEKTRRFGELQKLIPGMTKKMLTQHLRELERDGVVSRKVYAEVPPKVEYSLTRHGESLKPILKLMSAWGSKHRERYGIPKEITFPTATRKENGRRIRGRRLSLSAWMRNQIAGGGMSRHSKGLVSQYDDVYLVDGVRTPFADYNTVLGLVSPIDLGIKVAREVFKRSGVSPQDVDTVVAGSVAQASFDAYVLPRHVGLYSGVPTEVPAHLVQRVCGTGIEAIIQAADSIKLGKADLGLVVGSESMSRNPIAAYTHRGGFKLGQVEFKDFLWESLIDTCPNKSMGNTAEELAKRYKVTRQDADEFAAESFSRAMAAQKSGFLSGEIVPVVNETFELSGYVPRGIRLPKKIESFDLDSHVRPSPVEILAKLAPAFGGVQSGGNSSAIVDGAVATLVASGSFVKKQEKKPLAKVLAGVAVGVPPEIMGIGPVAAIRAVLEAGGLKLDQIDRIEINEAFAAQTIACARELDLDYAKLNVNGGAIAIGHPLGATGVRVSVTVARELKRSGKRYGIASACIGGGQGIALLVENPEAAN